MNTATASSEDKPPWERWSIRLTVIAAALAVCATVGGSLLSFADGRYQPSGDYASTESVQSLVNTIKLDRIERTEAAIEDTERRIRRIEVIPMAERTTAQQNELLDDKADLDRLKRQLKRIEGEDQR